VPLSVDDQEDNISVPDRQLRDVNASRYGVSHLMVGVGSHSISIQINEFVEIQNSAGEFRGAALF
jgi:hypothetical protein